MKVLLLSASNSRNAGGLYNSVRNLGQALLEINDVEPTVLAFRDKFSDLDINAYAPLTLNEYHILGTPKLAYSPDLKGKIQQLNPDIIHTQGIYLYSSYVNLKYTKKNHKPYLIAPRGMLDKWILNVRGWKKKIGLSLYENEHLKRANCIHALGMPEYEAIRRFGCTNPVAVVPNGVFLPNEVFLSEADLPAWKTNDDRKVLLFLSRLHPKKGIENLMQAWANTGSGRENWKIIIAGEGNGNEYLKSLLKLQNKLGLQNDVIFIGPQFHKEKDICFRCADAFILPSFSEGMPMAILEAWSYKLPVIMTPACNLPEGFTTNAALEIEPEPDSIASVLETVFSMPDLELKKIGENGYTLVREKFTWSSIASQMNDVYKWAVNDTPPPSTIKFD
jgi:glycosyltransferase involved in cell wall biosynthesis